MIEMSSLLNTDDILENESRGNLKPSLHCNVYFKQQRLLNPVDPLDILEPVNYFTSMDQLHYVTPIECIQWIHFSRSTEYRMDPLDPINESIERIQWIQWIH